jgi:hypothetical protein
MRKREDVVTRQVSLIPTAALRFISYFAKAGIKSLFMGLQSRALYKTTR